MICDIEIAVMKTCCICKLQLNIVAFNKARSKKDGLQSSCRLCSTVNAKAWALSNPERHRENGKSWMVANAEKHRVNAKAWQIANSESTNASGRRYYEKNLEKYATKNKTYREANPSKIAAYSAERRAAKMNSTPNWLTKEQYEQIEAFYIEAKNLNLSTGVQHQVDHICPLRGKNICGLHVPWNLQVLTATENQSKSNNFS